MHVHEGRSNGLINVNVFDIGHKPTPDRGTPPSFAKRARRASIAVVAVLVVVFVLVVVLFFFFFCLPLLFFFPMMLRGSERVNEIGNGVVRDRNVNLNPHTASALKFEILIFERSLPCTAPHRAVPCAVPGSPGSLRTNFQENLVKKRRYLLSSQHCSSMLQKMIFLPSNLAQM